MASKDTRNTPAIRHLKQAGIPFTLHPYTYVDKGGTRAAAVALGTDEHLVIKTLVMLDEDNTPIIILMHGDRQVSTKNLARAIGKKTIRPCDPQTAHKHTGYQVGGISPFGIAKPVRMCMQASIAALERIYVNAGRRGLLVELAPGDVITALQPQLVDVAIFNCAHRTNGRQR